MELTTPMPTQNVYTFLRIRHPGAFDFAHDTLHIEGDATMLDLPPATTLREDRIARARIAVFGKAGRRHVDQKSLAPESRVWNVEVSESDRSLWRRREESFELGIRCQGPDVLVVIDGVCVHDEQRICTFAKARVERERPEPCEVLGAELLALPRQRRIFRSRVVRTHGLGDIAIGIATDAERSEFA